MRPDAGQTSILALSVSDVTNPFYAEIIRGAQSPPPPPASR